MVVDSHTDGKTIGQHLSSEIHGHERNVLGRLSIVEADPDAEPSEDGTFAYAIAVDGEDGTRIAEAYLHPEHLRLDVLVEATQAAVDGEGTQLSIESNDAEPPRKRVFVQSGAEVKEALRVVRSVAEEFLENAG